MNYLDLITIYQNWVLQLCGQIKKSTKIIKYRLQAGKNFKKISNYTFVTTQKIPKSTNHSYWAFPLIFKKKIIIIYFKII